MEWTDAELDDLAVFLAKRMRPDFSLLCADDPPTPGDPVAAWRSALRDARDRDALPDLMARAAAAAPHDENLQHACGILRGPPPSPLRVVVAAALVGFVLVLGGGGAVAGAAVLSSAPADLDAAELATAPAAPVRAPATPAAPVAPAAEAPASPTEPLAVSDVPVVEPPSPEGDAAPAVAVAPSDPPEPDTLADGRCAGRPGEVVGYWYAGESAPGKVGQALTLDQSVNVRATYPTEGNRFDKRSPVRCVLSEGDRIVLAQAPIRVAGGHWWVPLVAGEGSNG